MKTNPCLAHVSDKKVTNFALMSGIYTNGIAKQFDLNTTTLSVLMGLACHFNPNKSIVYPSQEYLAEHVNTSIRSVKRAIKELTDKRLILKSKKRTSNVYVFTNIFFDALKMSPNECKIDTNKGDKMELTCIEQDKPEQINKINSNIFLLKNGFTAKTPLQKEYKDVFEQLSEKQLEEYKLLEGYDKEKWLIKKRKHFKFVLENPPEEKKEQPKAEFVEMIDIHKTREEAMNYLKPLRVMPKVLQCGNNLKIMQKWGISIEDLRQLV